jgi:hypothetical protein
MSSFLSSSSLGETNVMRKTTSVFHGYAIVDHEDIANAMEMLERSQDEQRQRLESGLVAKAERPLPNNVGLQKSAHQSINPQRRQALKNLLSRHVYVTLRLLREFRGGYIERPVELVNQYARQT